MACVATAAGNLLSPASTECLSQAYIHLKNSCYLRILPLVFTTVVPVKLELVSNGWNYGITAIPQYRSLPPVAAVAELVALTTDRSLFLNGVR